MNMHKAVFQIDGMDTCQLQTPAVDDVWVKLGVMEPLSPFSSI